jgi:DNA-binding transcriptional LysR family regulator
MPAFLELYPRLQLDWSLENRRVDLVRENYDAAIGSGVEADANVVARQLVPLKLLTVASPAYLARRGAPETADDLSRHDCIRVRSATTGRILNWEFAIGAETLTAQVGGRLILSDFDAILDAALAGVGIARLGAHHVLPLLDTGRLTRVLPQLSISAGAIHIYYTRARRTPAKVRAFVDFLTDAFSQNEYIKRVWALPTVNP